VRFRRRAPFAALTAAVVLAGCGGVGNPFSEGTQTNDTDAAFVRAMIAHERTVGSIAELGSQKALRVELRGIARDTLARHRRTRPDLELFESALRGRPVSLLGSYIRKQPPRFDAHGLRNAVSFDHEFLVRMIEQQEYAVTTAAAERDRGSDPRLRAFAASMYKSSRQDLIKLKHWLNTWYGPTQPPASPGGPPGGSGGGGGGGGGNGPGGGGTPPDV
jgi:uncharacterized protein (DUF305 family)